MGKSMTETELLELLDERGVAYELYRHDPIFSAQDPTPASIPQPELIVKNLLVETSKHDRRYLVTLRADDRSDLSALSRQLGCGHLSFVAPDQMEGLIGVRPGSATPFALLEHADSAVLVLDKSLPGTRVCCHPMHNAASIELACDDMVEVLKEHGVQILLADAVRHA